MKHVPVGQINGQVSITYEFVAFAAFSTSSCSGPCSSLIESSVIDLLQFPLTISKVEHVHGFQELFSPQMGIGLTKIV